MELSRNRLIGIGALLIILFLGLRSCGDKSPVTPNYAQNTQQSPAQVVQPPVYQEQQPVYDQQQPNVVVVQQPTESGGITAGHLAAGALGYMAGRSSNSGYNGGNRTYVNKTYVNKTYRTSPRKSYFGSKSRSRSITRHR